WRILDAHSPEVPGKLTGAAPKASAPTTSKPQAMATHSENALDDSTIRPASEHLPAGLTNPSRRVTIRAEFTVRLRERRVAPDSCQSSEARRNTESPRTKFCCKYI